MRMRCREAERWISVRVDGETIPAEKAEGLDRHLEECEDCRKVLADERRRAGALDSALRADLPADGVLGAAVVEEALRRPAAPTAVRKLLPRAVLGMAAGILIALGLRLTVFVPERPGSPSSSEDACGPSVLDVRWIDPEMVTSGEGWPLERGVQKQHRIYLFPARRPMDPQVILDVQNEQTDYLRPVNLQYH